MQNSMNHAFQMAALLVSNFQDPPVPVPLTEANVKGPFLDSSMNTGICAKKGN